MAASWHPGCVHAEELPCPPAPGSPAHLPARRLQSSAAMTSASMLLKTSNPAFSAALLTKSQALYAWGKSKLGEGAALRCACCASLLRLRCQLTAQPSRRPAIRPLPGSVVQSCCPPHPPAMNCALLPHPPLPLQACTATATLATTRTCTAAPRTGTSCSWLPPGCTAPPVGVAGGVDLCGQQQQGRYVRSATRYAATAV